MRQYYIEITDASLSQTTFHVSDDTHLLLESLQPGHQYTFRVATYTGTTEKGPFSEPISITLPSLSEQDTSSIINTQCHNQVPLMVTASLLGLVSLFLLVVAIVAGIYISYRLCKRDKKVVSNMPGQVPVYEMVDMPTSDNCSYHGQGHTNTEQLILKQEQAKGLSHEYLTPTINKRAGQGQPLTADKENTYQPLIPPRLAALGDENSEYQSLILKSSTAPPKFGVAPMGTALPAIPPKPKGM